MAEVSLTYDFALDPRLAMAWLTELIARPVVEISPAEYVGMLACYLDLRAACPDVPRERLPAQVPARGRALIMSAMREASQRNPKWMDVTVPGGEHASATKSRPAEAWEKFPEELWKAFFEWTNIMGTIAQTLMLLESLVRSVPVSWIAKLQGGKWELVDANASARRHAFGKAAKAAYKPRMILRARGVRLPWAVAGASFRNGATRIPVPNAATLKEGLKIARASSMRWVSKAAYSALPARGLLGGNAVGAALSLLPQLGKDIYQSGILDDPSSKENWRNFAVGEAEGQSGNVAGIAGGMALGAVAVWLGVTAAPALIVVGLIGGAVSQAGFNALGLNEDAASGMKWLLDEVAKL